MMDLIAGDDIGKVGEQTAEWHEVTSFYCWEWWVEKNEERVASAADVEGCCWVTGTFLMMRMVVAEGWQTTPWCHREFVS